MKKIIYNILFVLCLVFTLSSCENEIKSILNTTGDTSIHTFSINGVQGTINAENSTISVILPSGSSLRALSPVITVADGAIVTPNSGTAVDFADSQGNLTKVTYTVTNKDLYQKYTVSVDVARAKIISFKIGSVQGDIDDVNKKVSLYLPVGTDLTALFPIVEYTSGATISPALGSAVNFTNPVTYTLNYLGSTFNYIVTVIAGEKPKPILVIYNGEDVAPAWDPIASTINNGTINPKTDGINSTPTCVSIMRRKAGSDDGGRAWSGGALWHNYKVNIDPAVYNKFTMMVLKSSPGIVHLELQSDGELNKDFVSTSYSADHLGEWQELTFVIPASRTAIINNILVAVHDADTSTSPTFVDQMMYWDNLKAYPKQ